MKKIVTGCVVQHFEQGKCIKQEFTGIDKIYYEDEDGNRMLCPAYEYQPYNMIQPEQLLQPIRKLWHALKNLWNLLN